MGGPIKLNGHRRQADNRPLPARQLETNWNAGLAAAGRTPYVRDLKLVSADFRAPVTNQPRHRLMERLAELGIETDTTDHPPVFSVEESEGLYATISGGHTKNLFLKDTKGKLFLIVAHHATPVDLKRLPAVIGSARLSFGRADLLEDVLGVSPGSVTAFSVMNDTEQKVQVVFDQKLMEFKTINLHPMENTATTSIARDDLLRFIRATGHTPRIAALTID